MLAPDINSGRAFCGEAYMRSICSTSQSSSYSSSHILAQVLVKEYGFDAPDNGTFLDHPMLDREEIKMVMTS
jgi:hypothetical protein